LLLEAIKEKEITEKEGFRREKSLKKEKVREDKTTKIS
jgi:hypothetical protein